MSLSGRRSSGLPVREWEGRRWDFVVKSCHLQATYLSLSVRRSYGLPVRDREGRRWDFVVKSWANGTEHRRVYVLEHALEFISPAAPAGGRRHRPLRRRPRSACCGGIDSHIAYTLRCASGSLHNLRK